MQPEIEVPEPTDTEFSKALLTMLHASPILQSESTAEPDTLDVESTTTPFPNQLFCSAELPRTQDWFPMDVCTASM